MRWPSFWSSPKDNKSNQDSSAQSPGEVLDSLVDIVKPSNSTPPAPTSTSIPTPPKPFEWGWRSYTEPQTIISTIALTSACIGFYKFYRTFLRRIPAAGNISPRFFRKRSLFGHVTSVGDGDNFRIFHTPGGWLAGWGWWRPIPADKKALKNNTIHVRLAGVDAPEAAHFGRPAQPYSQEALDWLTSYVLGRRVRAYVYKPDQYQRVVATVYIRKGLVRRDVGLQMLRSGLATVYEAKTGAEFGKGLEEKYRKAEWWAKMKRKGIWAGKKKDFESPREYKIRYGSGTPIEEVAEEKK